MDDVATIPADRGALSRFYRRAMWWLTITGLCATFVLAGWILLPAVNKPGPLWTPEAAWAGITLLAAAGLIAAMAMARKLILRPRRWTWALSVFALALLVRGAAVISIPYVPTDDFLVYHQSAIGVAEHGVLIVPASTKHGYYCFYPPGQVYTLGGLYRVVGGEELMSIGDSPRFPRTPDQWSAWNRAVAAGIWLNVLLASLTAVGIGYIARQMLGELPGRVAGVLAALLPSSVFACFLLAAEVPQTFWIVMALCVYLRWITPRTGATAKPSFGAAVPEAGNLESSPRLQAPHPCHPALGGLLTGLCLGVACLFRPTFLPVFVLLTIHALLTLPRKKQALVAGAAMLLAMSATIAPWTIRNYAVTGAFIPISSNGGGNLYSGNNDWTKDGGYTGEVWNYLFANADNDVTINRLGAQKAKEWITSHPRRFAELAGLKFVRLWNTDRDVAWWALEAPDSFHQRQDWAPADYQTPHLSPAIQKAGEGASTGFYLAIVAAAIVTLFVRRRDLLTCSNWILIPLLIAFLSAVHMVFESQAKYHYTLVPLLCVLAAGVVSWRGRHADAPRERLAADQRTT